MLSENKMVLRLFQSIHLPIRILSDHSINLLFTLSLWRKSSSLQINLFIKEIQYSNILHESFKVFSFLTLLKITIFLLFHNCQQPLVNHKQTSNDELSMRLLSLPLAVPWVSAFWGLVALHPQVSWIWSWNCMFSVSFYMSCSSFGAPQLGNKSYFWTSIA